MNKRYYIVMGFALFSTFFGAGNLIFPIYLGRQAAQGWLMCMAGFLLTGVGIPILGVIASAKAGKSVEDLTRHVGRNFGKYLGTVIMLIIGPIFAVPRTGATVYEMAVLPAFPQASKLIVLGAYFIVTFLIIVNKGKVMDKIGKVLTPVLLTVIFVIIAKGVFMLGGEFTPIFSAQQFSIGFKEGYQTMDALGSILMGGFAIGMLMDKGILDRDEQFKISAKAGIVAAIGLSLVYGGLIFVGANLTGVQEASRTDLFVMAVDRILGQKGKIIMSLTVMLACLTTSAGLTAMAGDFFSNISNGRLPYKWVVAVCAVVSFALSNLGVDAIVGLAVPILLVVYPVVISIVIMSVFDNIIPNKRAYRAAMAVVMPIGTAQALSSVGIEFLDASSVLAHLPLSEFGLEWFLPCTAVVLIFSLVRDKESLRLR
ncbi:branched-chain amino acid:cation transporter, LIVCS family [Peptoclostridium litorale DSM 5388]|uniref:Branched-chain amino acid transport system carrier protein n=1 Tax=Peptoclostridium litorale DSM 5388 TaxID=1121324 RepID=A0A069RAB9_PEPLI|nr:branched-chain amino acid transport system II carrier protein [Peptoclostridium litorale]KDR94019.1 branched-chain amino acid transport system 2 carrier protein BraB [Peptoclostridium litorale DSM 5388]SIN79690.1 branched-chain amino acid:cation transporter, LIVCS family [Peptoclostridium litorale DSM 5388]